MPFFCATVCRAVLCFNIFCPAHVLTKMFFGSGRVPLCLADFFDGLSLLHIYLLFHIVLQFLAVAFRL